MPTCALVQWLRKKDNAFGAWKKGARTVLASVDAELVDAGRRLGQYGNSMTGSIHVVTEVNRKCREGKHQEPQNSQDVGHHNEL